MSETEIDARGLRCPLPVLRLQKVLLGAPSGTRIALLADDPVAVVDVPHFCSEGGHRLVATTELAEGARRYLVEKA
jgi:tRNA 2-thiouridine synthesizing protein A